MNTAGPKRLTELTAGWYSPYAAARRESRAIPTRDTHLQRAQQDKDRKFKVKRDFRRIRQNCGRFPPKKLTEVNEFKKKNLENTEKKGRKRLTEKNKENVCRIS